LEEYYRANVGIVVRPDDLSTDSKELFRNHDCCHIVFGLNTALDDEAIADVRTLQSVDVGFRPYVKYLMTNPDAQAVMKQIGYLRSFWIAVRAVPRALRALRAGRQMKKRWPWNPPAPFYERSLADLRAEFGIKVV
jgi:hypothetical protein